MKIKKAVKHKINHGRWLRRVDMARCVLSPVLQNASKLISQLLTVTLIL